MTEAFCNILKKKTTRIGLFAIGTGTFFTVLGWSAATAFQRHADPMPLAATDEAPAGRSMGARPAPSVDFNIAARSYESVGVAPAKRTEAVAPRITPRTESINQPPADNSVKLDREGKVIMVNGKPWTGEVFDHRPIRKVRVQSMKTTAYSPDEKSCGKWADGITASGKSVWMNGGRLVAADKNVPFGTILTIPGYNHGKPVQVWDRGGAIKGNRLDLLYPTHEIALQWGVQDLPVAVWEFVETD